MAELSPAGNDPLLSRLLAADDAAEEAAATADLLAREALPVVDRILASWLRRFGRRAPELREDLRGDVIVRLRCAGRPTSPTETLAGGDG